MCVDVVCVFAWFALSLFIFPLFCVPVCISLRPEAPEFLYSSSDEEVQVVEKDSEDDEVVFVGVKKKQP